MISFVVPAHNEEALLGQTLKALFEAGWAADGPFEVLVVDDASTDGTAAVARAHGAKVVTAACRQIAAARNAGARAAQGEILFFVDADTLLPPATLQKALSSLKDGAVGGGAIVDFDFKPSFFIRQTMRVFCFCYFSLCRWAAGCFIFVRRDAFEKIGGFDEHYFISEEIHLSKALKRLGSFIILNGGVITSGRKIRTLTGWQLLSQSVSLLVRGRRSWRRREGLDLWYSDSVARADGQTQKKR